MTKPLVLCIMDGVGIAAPGPHNAVSSAQMPFFNGLLAQYPHSRLDAGGIAVGLPHGTMGNSEVGHITIGAGRVVNQFLRRFEITDWSKNVPLAAFVDNVRARGGIVHVAGLMSDGRVHADINDTLIIVEKILAAGLRAQIHFIADGRDTPPRSAEKYIKLVSDKLAAEFKSGAVRWGTLTGRYYAMDRNNNLDRTELACDAIVGARGQHTADDMFDALAAAYARGESDEFIMPTVISGAVPMTAADGFLFANYRSDRARQIVRCILNVGAEMLCFSQYGEGLNEHCPALLADEVIENTLGDVLARAGLRQLRIAETEKYNHVTYFFDAERDIEFDGGDAVLIPSPAVATFDETPCMSAVAVTDALLEKLGAYDVVILNWANGDMVGHTGNMTAAVRAMECLDMQLARLVPAVLARGGTVLITADHGNAEQMWDAANNGPWTAHTTNPVNFIVVSNDAHAVRDGGLADIAPTMLKILGIDAPADMTGKPLVD